MYWKKNTLHCCCKRNSQAYPSQQPNWKRQSIDQEECTQIDIPVSDSQQLLQSIFEHLGREGSDMTVLIWWIAPSIATATTFNSATTYLLAY